MQRFPEKAFTYNNSIIKLADINNADMQEKFLGFIQTEKLFEKSERILLGISGGVDSMVMLSLLMRSGYQVAVAHCNFGLREEESDNDQLFVKRECQKNNIPFHTKHFDTLNYSKERGVSLQMAARDLRYSWFANLLAEFKYSCIAIAHNKNDLAETFLINLIRGTGIRGLTGIKAKAGTIVRPLLFACRNEILEYATKYNISFREDSSNRETKYKRNIIRHKIIPEFEKISSSFINNIYETTGKLKDIETIFTETIENRFESICIEKDSEYRIKIDSLISLYPLPSYLFEFLRRWNFPKVLIPDIIASLKASSGKKFYSTTHRIIKDRDYLIVTPLPSTTSGRFYIDEGVDELRNPLKLKITRITNYSGLRIPGNPGIAYLDLNMLHFPLILRKWQKGDYFQPLGLSGLKKISDFFIDNKFSLIEKEETWLLASGNRLVWIMGHRIDDRFKITERTKEILVIRILD